MDENSHYFLYVIVFKVYANTDMVLPDKTHNAFVYLLGDNFDFDKTASKDAVVSINTVNPNYAAIQTVYSLVLRNLLTEENRVFEESAIAADILKINPNRDSVNSLHELKTNVGECHFEYQLDLKIKQGNGGVFDGDEIRNEIRECSSHNPYADIPTKSSILSLTFQDALFRDVHVRRLPQNQSVTLKIPVEAREADAVAQNQFELDGNDLVYADLKKALSEVYDGGLNTDLRVVVAVTSRTAAADANSGGQLYFHRSDLIEPSKGNLSLTVDSIYALDVDREIVFHVNGR